MGSAGGTAAVQCISNHCSGAGDAEKFGARAAAADVSPKRLKELLTYPASWGPSEWGPISFLPEHDLLVSNMERQWGDLDKYRGLATSAKGTALPHVFSLVIRNSVTSAVSAREGGDVPELCLLDWQGVCGSMWQGLCWIVLCLMKGLCSQGAV